MTHIPTLEEIWSTAPSLDATFDPATLAELPPLARRYLCHAIEPGARLSTAVRLEMSGEIKLGDDWLPFEAEQVIRWDRGFVWRARVKKGWLSIKGADVFVDGEGHMRWKLLGIIPVMSADGPDITRSALARVEAESMWIPAVLTHGDVEWNEVDTDHLNATVHLLGDTRTLHFTMDPDGAVHDLWLPRWGNPEGGAFNVEPFGAIVDDERSFGGFTIPSKVRVGWFFGTDRFEDDGLFWKAEITAAEYR